MVFYTHLNFLLLWRLTHEQELKLENQETFADWSNTRLWMVTEDRMSASCFSSAEANVLGISTSNLERRGISIEMDGRWGSWEVTGQLVQHRQTVSPFSCLRIKGLSLGGGCYDGVKFPGNSKV